MKEYEEVHTHLVHKWTCTPSEFWSCEWRGSALMTCGVGTVVVIHFCFWFKTNKRVILKRSDDCGLSHFVFKSTCAVSEPALHDLVNHAKWMGLRSFLFLYLCCMIMESSMQLTFFLISWISWQQPSEHHTGSNSNYCKWWGASFLKATSVGWKLHLSERVKGGIANAATVCEMGNQASTSLL